MNQIMQLVRRHLVSGRQSMLMVHVMIHVDYFHIVVMYLIVPAILITHFWDETKKGLFCFLPEITVAIQEHMFYNINY